jgi:hypothetical protein
MHFFLTRIKIKSKLDPKEIFETIFSSNMNLKLTNNSVNIYVKEPPQINLAPLHIYNFFLCATNLFKTYNISGGL